MSTNVMAQRRTVAAPRLHLRPRWRKAVLVAHIVSAGSWIGLDVVMATMIVTMAVTDDRQQKAAAAQALELFAVWPMAVIALLSLGTGLVLGLASKYGLVRYWWVLVKLVLNIVLTVLVLVALGPEVRNLADAGRELASTGAGELDLRNLAFPPIVSPTVLLFATVLAVYKPWGRVRRRRDSPPNDPVQQAGDRSSVQPTPTGRP